ncbi:MAG: protein kinase [Acidobacteriota bacterium]|nr:protein kinase [Acidobacteriota bacterium]
MEDDSIQFKEGDIVADRFRVVRFIAKGGMGEVYEVEDTRLQGVHLALKTILPHIASKPDMHERFEREVLLARRVVHTNLCPIYDIFHCRHGNAEITFLTMKLLPGETLAARLKRQGPIALEEATPIVIQVASALAAAHDAGILHRDIKAANIMLNGSGPQVQACVTDFGLARAYQTDSTVLSLDGVAGTPGYLAPELFHGAPPSTASDVYALGVVIYDMLAGHLPPFSLDSKTKVTSDPAIAQLPASWKTLIACSLETEPSSRYQSISEALDAFRNGGRPERSFTTIGPPLSRRSAIGLGVAATAAAAGGVWFNWSRIGFALHPLPTKRFVALLGWPPPSDARIAPMVAAAIDAIGSELARAEAFDHNLLIIPHSVGKDMTSPAQLNELRESLGANLVLAVSGVAESKGVHLMLRVLDPAASRTLRESPLNIPPGDPLSLPQRAVRIAAQLLNVARFEPDDARSKVGTNNPDAFAAFQAGLTLKNQPNDTGLQAAIDKYKQAIDIDPHYARAYAGLAWAYCRLYFLHKDTSALSLAQVNCDAALASDPRLVEGHLALGSVLQYRGDIQGAFRETSKALAIDPTNPSTLVYQAQLYTRSNRWEDAAATFERVLKLRPNYWLAHHELAILYASEGRYAEALSQFRAVTLEMPKNALAFSNVGAAYLQQGKVDEAIENLTKSLSLEQSDGAASTMAGALRAKRKYSEALEFAKKAVSLGPDDSYNWLELGECYSFLQGHQRDAKSAYAKSASLAEQELQTNPSDGPLWMILALTKIKSGAPQTAEASVEKAERNHADDLDSQLVKARIFELLARRDEALTTAVRCLSRGATLFQFETMPDIGPLLKDPRFQEAAKSIRSKTIANL